MNGRPLNHPNSNGRARTHGLQDGEHGREVQSPLCMETMTTITILGLKTCDTCRKALKSLPEANFRDVRKDPLTKVDIVRYFERFGEDLINRRSTTWRALSEAERARNGVDLLLDHPTLMKRPLIEAPGGPYLGWGKDTQAALLGSG